jgi:alcohol dehydrogenase class IV
MNAEGSPRRSVPSRSARRARKSGHAGPALVRIPSPTLRLADDWLLGDDHDAHADGPAPLHGDYESPRVETIYYGPGAFDRIAGLVDRFRGERVFLVTSATLERAGVVKRLEALLGARIAGVHSETRQHVPRSAALIAAQRARDVHADMLISVGGGTSIDCAKAVGMCLAEKISEPDDFDAYRGEFTIAGTRTASLLEDHTLPHIAVPTTLSGAEHTGMLGIMDDERHEKDVFHCPEFVPDAIVLDPDVTADTPSWLWASTGMRAIDHAIEGILSRRSIPLVDALGLESIRILRMELERAAVAPADADVRMSCLHAAWLASYALTNVGVGLSHGIGYQLAARYDIPHGVTSCVVLPTVVEFNAPVVQPQLRRIAGAFGVDVAPLSDGEAAQACVGALRDLIERLGVPHRLRDVVDGKDGLATVAERTVRDGPAATNPRPVIKEDVLRLLEAVW